MNLRDGRHLIDNTHVQEAARLIQKNGFAWLYERTGREQPQYRYVVIDGNRYPTKAFGFLVAQLAGNTTRQSNDMNVNEAAAPLKRLGYVEVKGLGAKRTQIEEDAQKLSYYQILARPSQSAFRQLLLEAFGYKCVVTGVSTPWALEAAHVEPFCMQGADNLENGILLRADLHKLFDAGHLAIEPESFCVRVSEQAKSDYKQIEGTRISIPDGGPSADGFRIRWREFSSR